MSILMKLLFAMFFVSVSAISGVAAEQSQNQSELAQIKQAIERVRIEPDPDRRTRLGQDLVDLVRKSGAAVDDATIDHLAAMLADRSDRIRGSAALAIAAVGPRAKRTAPALETALEVAKRYMLEVQDRNFRNSGFPIFTGYTSAHDVCQALQDIQAPDHPDCDQGYFDDGN